MITAITTHKIEIFKLFYEHNMHDILKEKLILYVDKEDASEFRAIVDLKKTRIIDRTDIIKFYGDLYLPNAPYCKKMYFLNMIFTKGLINDDFYMTDDDILVYDESFNDIVKSDKIIYDKEPFPKVESNYNSWKPVYDFFKSNGDIKHLNPRATNFFVPKQYLANLSFTFKSKFDVFIRILKSEEEHITQMNNKSSSKRGCDWSVFYVEVPFFDVVFSSMNHDWFKFIPFYCVAYSELRKLKEKLKTEDTKTIMEQFCIRKPYPQKHPLLHYNVVNKEPLMSESFNYLNGRNMKHKNINTLLVENPKEFKKLNERIAKSLF